MPFLARIGTADRRPYDGIAKDASVVYRELAATINAVRRINS